MSPATGSTRRGAAAGEDDTVAVVQERRGGWEHFAHGGGLGVRGRGPTLDASFEQAALALCAGVCEPSHVRPVLVVHFELEAPDVEALLAAWLGAVLDVMRARGLVFGRFLVRVEGDRLIGRAWGEPFDRLRHAARPLGHVGPHHALVRHEGGDGEWCAQAVLAS